MVLAILEAMVPARHPARPDLAAPFAADQAEARGALRPLFASPLRMASAPTSAGRAPAATCPTPVARSLREALTDGSVTFIKLGQMLSSRPDLLPEAYVRGAVAAAEQRPPAEWTRVRAVLERDLNQPIDEVFEHVDDVPVAAASVAQVHLARLVGGEEVVVKVQRPDARRQALADLDIVLRLGAWLERRTSWGRRLGVQSLAKGFARSLEEELDYRVELGNMRAVAEGGLPCRPSPRPRSACTRGPLVIARHRHGADARPVRVGG